MLTQDEWAAVKEQSVAQRWNKSQLMKHIEDFLVVKGTASPTVGGPTSGISRAERQKCVSKIKSDPDAGLSAADIENRRKGVAVMTEAKSLKGERANPMVPKG